MLISHIKHERKRPLDTPERKIEREEREREKEKVTRKGNKKR